MISFEFAALDFAAPEKNQYAYRLEGFVRRVRNAKDHRFATYTNLPAGDYTFHVKGSNDNGVWNEEGREGTVHRGAAVLGDDLVQGSGRDLALAAASLGYAARMRTINRGGRSSNAKSPSGRASSARRRTSSRSSC